MHKKNKVFIIGLDGGTWKILDPLIEKGKMPNLKNLVEKGASGELKSTIPPVTPPAWTSFQTGVNPGKHGIFDFFRLNLKSNESTIVDSTSICIETIWDIASACGKKIITINVPLTYPPREDPNRITIGCLLTPRVNPGMVYPKEIFDAYIKRFDYKILGRNLDHLIHLKVEDIVKEDIEVEKTRFIVAKRLMEDYPWDLFMLHIQSTDRMEHAFYHFLDPSSPDFNKDRYEVISKFFQAIDKEIGDLVRYLDDEVTLIIASDHGAKRQNKLVNMNAWLKNQGFLIISRDNFRAKCVRMIRKWDKFHLTKIILSKFFESKTDVVLGDINLRLNNQIIDRNKSKAYMPHGSVFGAIFINQIGSLESTKKEIIERLNEFRDPDTGKRIVKKIYLKEDIYSGPYLDRLPDLSVEFIEGYSCCFPNAIETDVLRKAEYPYNRVGTHDLDGMLVISSKSVKSGLRIHADIIDIAPTILSLLGIKVPAWMEGRVIEEAFTESLNVKINSVSTPQALKRSEEGLSRDHEEVVKRLKSLGYL